MSTTVVTKVGTKNADQVVLLDAAGDQVTSFGGGTQYADGVAAATPTGTQINWNDAGTQRAVSAAKPLPVTASIDTTGLATSAEQQSQTTHLATIAGDTTAIETAIQLIDDTVATMGTTTYTEASTKAITIGAVRRDANTTLVDTTNELAPLQVNATGELKVAQIQPLPAGTNAIGKLAANSGVDIGDVDILSIAAGDNNIGNVDVVTMPTVQVQSNSANLATQTTAAAIQTSVELIDDAVATLGTTTYTEAATKGLIIGAVRRDADTTLANTTNEITPLQVDANGYLKVEVFSGQTLPVSVASGGIASGAIAAGAITAGSTSIATTEDTASAAADHLVKIAAVRLDTPVANANVSNDGDYTQLLVNNFGKLWISGTVLEDTAHVAGEAIQQGGSRRIDTAATSAGSDGDWATQNQSAEGAAWATLTPTTTSGLSVANFTSGDTYTALTNTAQVIKASAGNLYGYYIYNPNATVAYVMVYNIAAASVTVGTSTALLVFAIPATSGANLMFPYPITFSNAGWSCAAATTGGGNTAPGTALEAMFWYK